MDASAAAMPVQHCMGMNWFDCKDDSFFPLVRAPQQWAIIMWSHVHAAGLDGRKLYDKKSLQCGSFILLGSRPAKECKAEHTHTLQVNGRLGLPIREDGKLGARDASRVCARCHDRC